MSAMPLPVDEGPEHVPRRRPRALRLGIAVLLLGALGGGGWIGARALQARRAERAQAAATRAEPMLDTSNDSLARAPQGVRVKVQVVNATRVRGLGRRATQALRDRGYDVVEVTTTGQLRDSTLVLDRSGHPAWGQRLARAMSGARIEARPDSSHYLDLTVLVGRAWHPPAQPFYP